MGIFGSSKEDPEPVEVAGRALGCLVCGNRSFWHKRAQVHGAMSSFFDMEWATPSADCAVCSQCGYIHWFMPLK